MSDSPVRSVEHAAQTRDHWLDDSAVTHCQDASCGGAFSTILRRHHCRFCGGIFCSKCLQYITLKTSAKAKKPFRTCNDCLLRYKESCFPVSVRLGSTQRALPESDPRVASFRAQKTKSWGASLWGAPPPVFECKVFVHPADKGADPRSLVPFLTQVTFDLKPGLRTPREKHVQGAPYELEFLADAKGECKMTLAFKDGDQIYRHQVPLKPDADALAETECVWNVCVDQTFQLDGSDLPRSPGPRGLITGATTAVGKIIGRVSVNSDSSEPVDAGQLDNWLEEITDQEETPEQKAHRFAEAASGRSLTPPRRRDPEPEPEQRAGGHFTTKMFFRVEKRSQLDPSCEPSTGAQRRWLEEGAVVEVLETKWIGDDESPTQRVRTIEGWATAVHGTTKYLRRDRKATRPCAAPASQAGNGVEVDDSVEGPLVSEPHILDESLPTAAAAGGMERSVSQQLAHDRQLVADQNKQRAERERLENEERIMAAQRKREEAEEKRKARVEAEEKEKARARALEAAKRAEQEREARRLEVEKAERMAREAEQRAAQMEEEARRKAAKQRALREEEERAAEEALARAAAERAAAKSKSAALKRERAKLQREREGKGGTLLVSVGHLSLVDDDIGAYVPFLKINCDNVVGKRSVNGGQHRAICPPELVPYQMPGGTDFLFAVQPSCKHFMLDLWDESMLGARFNSVLGSKQVPLHRIRCADSVWPDHYAASAFGGLELPRDSGTWSALSEEFELKDAKSGKTKGKICLTMRWAPWPDEGGPEDEQIKVEFTEAGSLGKRCPSVCRCRAVALAVVPAVVAA